MTSETEQTDSAGGHGEDSGHATTTSVVVYGTPGASQEHQVGTVGSIPQRKTYFSEKVAVPAENGEKFSFKKL